MLRASRRTAIQAERFSGKSTKRDGRPTVDSSMVGMRLHGQIAVISLREFYQKMAVWERSVA
jgi:hypothetical protein